MSDSSTILCYRFLITRRMFASVLHMDLQKIGFNWKWGEFRGNQVQIIPILKYASNTKSPRRHMKPRRMMRWGVCCLPPVASTLWATCKTTRLSVIQPVKKSPVVFFRRFDGGVVKCPSILGEQRWRGWHLAARRIAETPPSLSRRCGREAAAASQKKRGTTKQPHVRGW